MILTMFLGLLNAFSAAYMLHLYLEEGRLTYLLAVALNVFASMVMVAALASDYSR